MTGRIDRGPAVVQDVPEHGEPVWMSTPEVVDRVRAGWRAVRLFVEWLTENVGPTQE